MELLMSPIGLMMAVINLSTVVGQVEGEVGFNSRKASYVLMDFTERSHLGYRMCPLPRPP